MLFFELDNTFGPGLVFPGSNQLQQDHLPCCSCPSPCACGQQVRMCSSDPAFWQRGHSGVLAKPQRNRLDGLGRTPTVWVTWSGVAQNSIALSSGELLLPIWSMHAAVSSLLSYCSSLLPTLLGPPPGSAVTFPFLTSWLAPETCRSGLQPCLSVVDCLMSLPLPTGSHFYAAEETLLSLESRYNSTFLSQVTIDSSIRLLKGRRAV